MRSALPFLALLLTACGPDADTLAREALLADVTHGPEELLVSGHGDVPAADALVRTCDPAAEYAALLDTYDADGDGSFSDEEAEAIHEALGGAHGPHGHGLIRLLRIVYDIDQDGSFSEEELATLFEDFAARCDTLQAELLARFDTDLDGTLSAAELTVAAETLASEAEAAEAAEADDDHDGHGERHHGRGDHDGHDDHDDHDDHGWFGGAPDLTEVPPEYAEWDTDGDGTWSEAELEAFRAEWRERIRTGLPLDPHEEATAEPTDTGGSDTGGSDTGGSDTGGSDTGGSDTGGSDTGGADTGGSDTGGSDTGGSDTGGADTAAG
jgi:Ca2+-binding EF-hand superfamily protein